MFSKSTPSHDRIGKENRDFISKGMSLFTSSNRYENWRFESRSNNRPSFWAITAVVLYISPSSIFFKTCDSLAGEGFDARIPWIAFVSVLNFNEDLSNSVYPPFWIMNNKFLRKSIERIAQIDFLLRRTWDEWLRPLICWPRQDLDAQSHLQSYHSVLHRD